MPLRDAEPRPRRVWPWAAGVFVLLVAAGLAALLKPPAAARIPTARAERRDLVVPILCDGTLEPPPGGEIFAPAPATVGVLRVKEGERVAKGTPLVTLEDPELAARVLDARAEVARLSAEKARAEADAAEAKRAEGARKKALDQDTRLLAERAIPRAAYEADERALSDAVEKTRAAEAALRSFTGRLSRLDLAVAAAHDLERRAGELTARAPADGVVYGLPRKAGEAVKAGELIASITDPARTRVRARVDQPDLPRVAAGQRLLVTFDGLPDKRWEGRVTSVSAGVREVGGREVGEVLGELADPEGALPKNASVNVQVVAGERKGALVVPRGAVLHDGDARYVFSPENGRARRHEVKTGLVGLNEVEVTSGLAEGQDVLLPGAEPLADGARVLVKK